MYINFKNFPFFVSLLLTKTRPLGDWDTVCALFFRYLGVPLLSHPFCFFLYDVSSALVFSATAVFILVQAAIRYLLVFNVRDLYRGSFSLRVPQYAQKGALAP